MNKKLEDYLHLYLPYNIKCQTPEGIGLMCTYGVVGLFGFGMSPGYKQFSPEEGIRPILRPLSDMTEEEGKDAFKDFGVISEGLATKLAKDCAGATRYLLSKHFDLFGLIDAGLAIDKTKM